MKTMLLSKLKVVCAVAVAVSISAGAAGLTYRASASPPQQATGARAADDLDELRLEIAALRKGLQTTRDRVKTLEDEVQALRGQGVAGGGSGNMMKGGGMMGGPPKMPGMGGGMGAPGFQTGGFLSTRGFEFRGGGPGSGPNAAAQGTKPGTAPSNPGGGQPTAATEPGNVLARKRLFLKALQAESAAHAVANAEALLRRLKDHPDDKEAADALEQAVQQLKERAKGKAEKPNFPGQ
jgi:hypothetical protein